MCRLPPGSTLALLVLTIVSCAGGSREPEVDPEVRFLRVNAAVIDYLSRPERSADERIEGVEVTIESLGEEGAEPVRETYLARVRYRGVATDLPERVRLHWIETREGERAVLWVERGGEPFSLPECDAQGPGYRARRITGEIYTWQRARPLDGVLISPCPKEEWRPGRGSADPASADR